WTEKATKSLSRCIGAKSRPPKPSATNRPPRCGHGTTCRKICVTRTARQPNTPRSCWPRSDVPWPQLRLMRTLRPCLRTRWNLPRWKFTDSCGRTRVPGAIHFGCAHDGHTGHHATRREFLKGGVALVGAAGLATIVDPRDLFAQVRVFPPPPPAVS